MVDQKLVWASSCHDLALKELETVHRKAPMKQTFQGDQTAGFLAKRDRVEVRQPFRAYLRAPNALCARSVQQMAKQRALHSNRPPGRDALPLNGRFSANKPLHCSIVGAEVFEFVLLLLSPIEGVRVWLGWIEHCRGEKRGRLS